MATTGNSPLTVTKSYPIPLAGLTVDTINVIGEAPFAGVISYVGYIPDADVTGDDTDTRSFELLNKGAAAGQNLSVATIDLVTSTDLSADIRNDLTLSGTAANLVTALHDVLVLTSTHSGDTGLADPGGTLVVTFVRA